MSFIGLWCDSNPLIVDLGAPPECSTDGVTEDTVPRLTPPSGRTMKQSMRTPYKHRKFNRYNLLPHSPRSEFWELWEVGNMACGCIYRLLKWAIFIVIVVLLIRYWLATKDFVFTPEGVAAVAKKFNTGPDVTQNYDRIYKELLRRYPGRILPEKDLQWMFVNAGGWMGSVCILHASLTEYVLFFGSALETSGHSGRYWANITDTLLTGTFRQWKEGSLSTTVYKTGDTVVHTMGEATGVNFAAGTWMVEYGRGFIPSTMGFALADTLFSTHDFVTMFYMLRVYSKALFMEAVHCAGRSQDYLTKLLS